MGSALSAELTRRRERLHGAPPVPWATPERSHAVLGRAVAELAQTARDTGTGWRVAWCAGAGVTGTGADTLHDEVATFSVLLDELSRHSDVPGSLFVASSAGGLYAGSPEPPFTEAHPVVPLSAYGEAKLAQEDLAREFARRTGVPTLVGRIANLYGPGQNLAKAQGLISHLCRAHLTGQPISIYVPLDTVRDYLFVADAAAMVADALDVLDAARTRHRRAQDPRLAAGHHGRRPAGRLPTGSSSACPGWSSAPRPSRSTRPAT